MAAHISSNNNKSSSWYDQQCKHRQHLQAFKMEADSSFSNL
jgi:hypothetical protein